MDYQSCIAQVTHDLFFLYLNIMVDSYIDEYFCISGTQKIYVKTWGCSHNNSDSEYMAGQLAACGYKITGKGHCI